MKNNPVSPSSKLVFSLFDDLFEQPRHHIVLRLTLLLLFIHGSTTLLVDVPLRVICGLMLLSPALLLNQVMWVMICGLVWLVNATVWLWIDNHKILIAYWCLVCALATSSKNSDGVLAWNGRLLIGLTFLFATGWKVLSGEYWDGSFLEYTFLTDIRVESVASIIGGLSQYSLEQNRLFESMLGQFPELIGSVFLLTSPRLQIFTLSASYWTIFIEGLVAVFFLIEDSRFISRCRDWLLITFVATTYFLLPVLGFAYVLIIMGFAQCPPKYKWTRISYICLFGVLQFARLPWESILV
ncbi:MAG: hypothetical protein AB4050_08140 [Synechococcus sp.]